jgi:hypothetical protein
MKNILLVLAAGIITTAGTHAQNTQTKPGATSLHVIQTLAPVNSFLLGDDKKLINPKAIRDFSRTFSNVTNEDWHIIRNGFIARFKLQDMQYRIVYNKKGSRLATFCYYNEQQLPADVRRLIKSTFYDFNIVQVTEVSVAGKTAYLVNIQDKTSLKTIKVVNDEMEIMQDVCILK